MPLFLNLYNETYPEQIYFGYESNSNVTKINYMQVTTCSFNTHVHFKLFDCDSLLSFVCGCYGLLFKI